MASQFDLDGIDTEEIGRLMDLLAESDVEECEFERGDLRVSLQRTVRQRPVPEEVATGPQPSEETAPKEPLLIRAQAVGVFTRSERSSGAPKVEIGSKVGAGDVVGYIEVMMIPHSVFSDHEGIVDSLLVEDGQPVEYGQPLVALRPL